MDLPTSEPFRALVREAMHRAHLSQKAFAITCGQAESVVSEALAGSRNLASEWLWKQDRLFWVHLVAVVKEAREIADATVEATYDERMLELFELMLRRRRTA